MKSNVRKVGLVILVGAIIGVAIIGVGVYGYIEKFASVAGDADPCWSPDGKKIAFSSDRDRNQEI